MEELQFVSENHLAYRLGVTSRTTLMFISCGELKLLLSSGGSAASPSSQPIYDTDELLDYLEHTLAQLPDCDELQRRSLAAILKDRGSHGLHWFSSFYKCSYRGRNISYMFFPPILRSFTSRLSPPSSKQTRKRASQELTTKSITPPERVKAVVNENSLSACHDALPSASIHEASMLAVDEP